MILSDMNTAAQNLNRAPQPQPKPKPKEKTIMISYKRLEAFVKAAETRTIGSKAVWHRTARAVGVILADLLGEGVTGQDVRTNKGGPASWGETIIHGEWVYIDLSVPCYGGFNGFMYRSCKDRKDYSGGANRWMKWGELLNLTTAARKMAQCRN